MILKRRQTVSLDAARAPDGMRIYAIGDVHGRLDLLTQLHDMIANEIAHDKPADWRLIHLGDYVDRGPESAGVIETLIERTAADARVLALAGNHDRAFLDFMAEPDRKGLFAKFGGDATALSYGIDADFRSDEAARRSRDRLADAIPPAHLALLEALPFSVAFGDYFFCHAGVRPSIRLDKQVPADLAWIRGDFLTHQGLYEKIVVHGHTPGERVALLANRINVDTGAYFSGRLSAVVLEGANKRVIEAIGPEGQA